MARSVTGLEEFLAKFRPTLPARSGTAQAIDRRAPFERIACQAIEDGLTEFADGLGRLIETGLRRSL